MIRGKLWEKARCGFDHTDYAGIWAVRIGLVQEQEQSD